MQQDSKYDNKQKIDKTVNEGKHRDAIGGLWEEMGQLQLDFLIQQGLKPNHKLLDVGCGSLRGGVKFVEYLESGKYFGIDNNQSLLNAGFSEIKQANLATKLPQENLVMLDNFEFEKLNQQFDFVIAQSVFSHLNFNRIRLCLGSIADVLVESGTFYATFFVVDKQKFLRPTVQSDNLTTYTDKDPFHYSIEDFEYMVGQLPLKVEYIGHWNHPRNQKMLKISRIEK